jgi:hypothetical protein
LFLKEWLTSAIIFKVNHKQYYTAHNDANNGKCEKLFFLIGKAVLRSLEIYLNNLDDSAGDYLPISSIVNDYSLSYGQE